MENNKRSIEIRHRKIEEDKYKWYNIVLYTKTFPAFIALITAIMMSIIIPSCNYNNEKKRDLLNSRIKAVEFFSKSFTEQVGFYNSYKYNLCKSKNEKDPEDRKFLREKAEKYFERIIESVYSYELGVSIIKVHFHEYINFLKLDEYEKLLYSIFINDQDDTKNLDDSVCSIDHIYKKKYNELNDKYNEIFTKLTKIVSEGQ